MANVKRRFWLQIDGSLCSFSPLRAATVRRTRETPPEDPLDAGTLHARRGYLVYHEFLRYANSRPSIHSISGHVLLTYIKYQCTTPGCLDSTMRLKS